MNLKDLLFAFFLGIVIVVAYLRHEKNTIQMNGETYTHAGMAELQPGIFAPVYRRIK